jgi:hypothetical protein
VQFLFYNDSSRSQVALEKLIMAMTRDVSNTVSEVYVTSIELASGPPVKVFFLMLYLVAFVNAKSPLRQTRLAVYYVALQPLLIFAFLAHRKEKGFRLREAQFRAESRMVESVIQCVLNFNLIRDYDHITESLRSYGELVAAYNRAVSHL